MWSVLNHLRVLNNCEIVARSPSDENSLHLRFATAIRDLLETPLAMESDRPVLTFGRPAWCDFLIQRNVISPAQRESAMAIPERLRDQVRQDYVAMRGQMAAVHPGALWMLDLVVSEIAVFQVDRPEAGSHSAAIGFLWINPRPTWSIEYLSELVFHEVLHNILFLEDMTRGLMPDMELLESDATRAYSAVRHTTRYFDSALHALFVAAGMIGFHHEYARRGRPDHAKKLQEYLMHGRLAAADLNRVARDQTAVRRPILTPNGEDLLSEMTCFFNTPNLDAFDNLLATSPETCLF